MEEISDRCGTLEAQKDESQCVSVCPSTVDMFFLF